MIISIRHVKKSRRRRSCGICDRSILVGSGLVDLYGAADYGDRPYHIALHLACAAASPSKDLVKHKETCIICLEAMQ